MLDQEGSSREKKSVADDLVSLYLACLFRNRVGRSPGELGRFDSGSVQGG